MKSKQFKKYSVLLAISCLTWLIILFSFQQAVSRTLLYPQEPFHVNGVEVVSNQGTNEFIFSLPVKAEANVRLQILDMLGRELKDTTFLKLTVPGEVRMNISNLHVGLYFFKFSFNTYQWATKVVRQDNPE